MLMPDPALAGGVNEFVRTQLAYLSADVDVTTIVIGRRPNCRGRLQTLRRLIVDCVGFVKARFQEGFDVVAINPSLAARSLIRDGAFAFLTRLLSVKGVVVFFHGWDQALGWRIRESRWRRALFRCAFGGVNHFYVLSSEFKETLVRIGVSAAKVEVTTTMFDGALFGGAREMSEQQAGSGPMRVIYMGRVVAAKGVSELVDAVGTLNERGTPVELVVAGDGPDLPALRDRISARQAQDFVQCPGFVSGESKRALLARADLFVLPTSHPEGCPVAMLEAMASGLPVLATRVGGIPEAVEDGINGYLLAEATVEALVERLAWLAENPGQRRDMGARNREVAWSKFEGQAVTAALEDCYRRLCGLDAPSAP